MEFDTNVTVMRMIPKGCDLNITRSLLSILLLYFDSFDISL